MGRRRKRQNAGAIVPISIMILMGAITFYDDLAKLIPSLTVSRDIVKYNNYDVGNIPEYSKDKYVVLNGNVPYFHLGEYDSKSFESYSELDSLGRCGVAMANIGVELMPTEERGSIGMIKPSGWHTVKYNFVDGKYLYNRCHLIGYQLTGENANEKNLITCTRSMNAKVMVEFENRVANYIKETKNHVLYRVTPIYEEKNLLAKGVEMEALSIEDGGAGIKFNVFIYNVEDGVEIDYSTGKSRVSK